jgi:DNA-binding beta-propeller fold protein YncE
MIRARWIGLSVLVGFLTSVCFAENQFNVLKKINVPGDDGWDCLTVDSEARRLYIAHGTKVDVLDIETDKVIGTISDTSGVHGVAVVSSLNRGFISQGKTDSVAVFDLVALKKVGEIKTEKTPDVIVFDPATQRVFAFNGRSQNATVIDAKKGEAVGTISLNGKPEFAVADGQGHVFVNLEDKGSLIKINSRKLAVEATWPLPGCEEPSGLAFDSVHQRLFSGCGNKIMAIVDSENGKLVATVPIGEHADGAVFDSELGLAFSPNGGDGTLTVIEEKTPEKFEVIENASTEKGARTIALDSKTHRLFLVTSDFGPAPAPTTEHPHPRPSIVPGTFRVLVVGKK